MGSSCVPAQVESSRSSSSEHVTVTWAQVTEDGERCTDWRDSLTDGLEVMSGREKGGS